MDESSAEFSRMPAEVFNVRPERGRAKNKTERGGRERDGGVVLDVSIKNRQAFNVFKVPSAAGSDQ